MAELPELWSDRSPEKPAPPAPLFGRPPSFGVAHDLELMKQGALPPRTRRPQRHRRLRGEGEGSWAGVRRRWADSDNTPADIWHRIRCRTGHHELRGGEQMQLGSRYVYLERRCIWCDAAPTL